MTNVLPGVLVKSNGKSCKVRISGGTEVTVNAQVTISEGTPVFLSVRPEGFRFTDEGGPNVLHGHVAIAMPLGPSIIYDVVLDSGGAVKIEVARGAGRPKIKEGEKVSLAFAGGKTVSLFPNEETTTKEA